MTNKLYPATAVSLVLLLIALLLGQPTLPATAAPQAIPTPVSVTHSGVRSDIVTFWDGEVITEDGCSPLLNIADHSKIDLQWTVNQTTTNTTTFSLRFSNDGEALAVGATVLNANAADATDMQQFAVFGRQACIYADVTNSNPIEVTFVGVAK